MLKGCQTVVYKPTGAGTSYRLHLSPSCADRVGETTPVERRLETFPPAWRDWCSQCSHR
jgi:hypothetical protein